MLLSREIMVLTNAIAFNFLLCLFPLLLVVAALSEQLPGRRAVGALLALLQELIPFGRETMAESVRSLSRLSKGFEIASLLLIVWGSSGIFMPVEMVLNKAWGGGRMHREFWKSRLLAFLMTMAGGLLALLSSALSLTCVLFFLIYRVIPDPPVGTRVAVKAALWAGFAWESAKYGFVFQLGRMNLQAYYGPLAFAVSLVLWAFVSSLVLVFGALMAPVAEPSRRS
jgi:membrane protein/epoxyqueuosine reductase